MMENWKKVKEQVNELIAKRKLKETNLKEDLQQLSELLLRGMCLARVECNRLVEQELVGVKERLQREKESMELKLTRLLQDELGRVS
ncbi:MAG: hypothetical protein HQK53_07335, partial [Oligoflexia bacterium]|nr:hypothetical protein [Oligoflexia bacterium]